MSPRAVHRRVLLTVAAVAALLAAMITSPAVGADPTPFDPDPRYSKELSSRIVVYNTALAELNIKLGDFKERTDDLLRRIDEHNAAVDAYPNRTAPPAVADRINAEGNALRAEQSGLSAELDGLKAEAERLTTERAAIAAAAAAELNALIQANPPPHTAPQPGNQYQRLPPAPDGPVARAGGNVPSRAR